jgi:hypothetical protein
MWRWAGACAIGTSHTQTGLGCQDRAGCRTSDSVCGPVIVAIISDGAGSVEKASTGAAIVCMELHRRIAAYLRSGSRISNIGHENASDWIDSVRDRIGAVATAANLRPRVYAATVVALLADNDGAVVLHVGDGAATVRDLKTQEWSVPSWPFHGEYASTTRFVIDDPHPQFELFHVSSPIDRFAIFSDGIENLVLDIRKRVAPAAFFDRLSNPVAAWQGQGRNRNLSRHLRKYLAGEAVCAATDDDKSLILGVRT